jgi:hypothetical protein
MGSNEVKRRGSNPQRDLFTQVFLGMPEGFRVSSVSNVSSTSSSNAISTFSSVKVGGMMQIIHFTLEQDDNFEWIECFVENCDCYYDDNGDRWYCEDCQYEDELDRED